MANTLGLGPSARKGLRVQVPPSAPNVTCSEMTAPALLNSTRPSGLIIRAVFGMLY